MRIPDAMLRATAYRLLTWHDGQNEWPRHRRAFRQLAAANGTESPDGVSAALRRVVQHAYRTVPFYYDAYRAIGFDPSGPFSIDAFRRLPLLSKEDIRARKADLVSRAYDPCVLDLDFTGGTTGTQTAFYRDRGCSIAKLGRQWGVLERCGHRVGDRRGVVWGIHNEVAQSGRRSLRAAIRAYGSAHEGLCCTTMSDDAMHRFHARLKRFRPRSLYGYPSALGELARFIVAAGLPPIHVEHILCTAERLTEAQRQLLQQVFGGEVFNLYCSREHGCVGFECRVHEGLHVDTGSVHLEVLREGRPVGRGESGEIVITDLLNYGMPFVRHATADMATILDAPCQCGLRLPRIAHLDGRTVDRLYRPDGRSVTGLMLTDLFAGIRQVRAAQFVQTISGAVDVNIVSDGAIDASVRARIVNEVREIMGPEMAVNIRRVEDIPRNPRSGKYQEVICRLRQPVPAPSCAGALAAEGAAPR